MNMIELIMEELDRPDMINFDKRIWLFKLKGEGKSHNEVARLHFDKYGITTTPQAISRIWQRIRFYTLDELELHKEYYEENL